MKQETSSFAPAHLVSAMDQGIAAAERAKALMQTADDAPYGGRYVSFEGAELLNFGCCSYLGLEVRRELKDGAIAAIERFGTQFPFPRAMLQSPLYEELDALMQRIVGGHVVVAASTSLAHVSALPVVVEPGDAVVIDIYAHASLHTAAALLRGIPVETLRHSNMDMLERKVKELSTKYRRVWYLLDGLYSMRGDFAPMDALATLLAKYPALHVYADDAHSTSWIGTHGRGWALERLTDRSRVVGLLSLNKAFSAGGAAIVFSDPAQAARVRRSGGPMVFSGAIQPPLLGAAVASAKIHLSDELPRLQAELQSRMQHVVEQADRHGVPLVDESLTPVFFVRCGGTEGTFAMVEALRERKICVCAAVYPIVPRNQAGVRFTVTLHNTREDIETLMGALAEGLKRTGQDPSSAVWRVGNEAASEND
jgi:7-keto-8-aminopelargonate synthetase-like enzyme